MAEFEFPGDLTFNREAIADPEAFARDADAASWLFLCGDDFAAMDRGMSYAQVQAAVPESRSSAIAYLYAGLHAGATPDEVLAAADADSAPFTGVDAYRAFVAQGLEELAPG